MLAQDWFKELLTEFYCKFDTLTSPSQEWSGTSHQQHYPLVVQHSYRKSPFLMGKRTISMAIFQFAMSVMIRGYIDPVKPIKSPFFTEIRHRSSRGCLFYKAPLRGEISLFSQWWHRGQLSAQGAVLDVIYQ